MQLSDWIAFAALIIAVLSWLDTWRRTRRDDVSFTLSETEQDGYLILRNTGKVAVAYPRIDPESITRFEVPTGTMLRQDLQPGESVSLIIRRNSHGNLPDSITLIYGPNHRPKRRVIPLPLSASAPKPN